MKLVWRSDRRFEPIPLSQEQRKTGLSVRLIFGKIVRYSALGIPFSLTQSDELRFHAALGHPWKRTFLLRNKLSSDLRGDEL